MAAWLIPAAMMLGGAAMQHQSNRKTIKNQDAAADALRRRNQRTSEAMAESARRSEQAVADAPADTARDEMVKTTNYNRLPIENSALPPPVAATRGDGNVFALQGNQAIAQHRGAAAGLDASSQTMGNLGLAFNRNALDQGLEARLAADYMQNVYPLIQRGIAQKGEQSWMNNIGKGLQLAGAAYAPYAGGIQAAGEQATHVGMMASADSLAGAPAYTPWNPQATDFQYQFGTTTPQVPNQYSHLFTP